DIEQFDPTEIRIAFAMGRRRYDARVERETPAQRRHEPPANEPQRPCYENAHDALISADQLRRPCLPGVGRYDLFSCSHASVSRSHCRMLARMGVSLQVG